MKKRIRRLIMHLIGADEILDELRLARVELQAMRRCSDKVAGAVVEPRRGDKQPAPEFQLCDLVRISNYRGTFMIHSWEYEPGPIAGRPRGYRYRVTPHDAAANIYQVVGIRFGPDMLTKVGAVTHDQAINDVAAVNMRQTNDDPLTWTFDAVAVCPGCLQLPACICGHRYGDDARLMSTDDDGTMRFDPMKTDLLCQLIDLAQDMTDEQLRQGEQYLRETRIFLSRHDARKERADGLREGEPFAPIIELKDGDA